MDKASFSAVVVPKLGLNQTFNLEADIPDGYQQLERLTDLIYPVELGAIGNWTPPTGGEDPWPRVDLGPESGVLFWFVQGNVAYDYEVMPSQGDWFVPTAYPYLGPSAVQRGPVPGGPAVVGTEQAFTGADLVGSPWENSYAWARLIPIASADGDTPPQPQYVVLYVFAGPKGPSLQVVNEVIQTLTIDYV